MVFGFYFERFHKQWDWDEVISNPTFCHPWFFLKVMQSSAGFGVLRCSGLLSMTL
jgi:hypothetical protein